VPPSSDARHYALVRVIQELVEDGLRELADEAEQRRLWTASTGPEVSSFTECVCRLFDDSGLVAELDRGREVYTQEIDQSLVDLERLLRRVDGRHPPEVVLADSVLAEARSLAVSILGKLNDLRHV
jgi:hypothetical protein